MWVTAEYPLEVIQGETLSQQFQFNETDDSGTVKALDLSGYKARAQVVNSSGVLIATMTPTIPNPTNGSVLIVLADEDTTKIAPNVYRWDLALDVPDGTVEKPLRGDFTVRQGATLVRSS